MERIRRFIRELSEQQWLEVQELRDWKIDSSVYRLPGQYDKPQPYTEGSNYDLFPSVQGTTYFFRRTFAIPAAWSTGHVGLVFESGGEGLLRVNGESRQGLDRNHTFVTLAGDASGHPLELEIELFDPIPEPVDPLNQQAVIQPPIRAIRSQLVLVNGPVQSLMYTVVVIRDSAVLLPEQDQRRTRMLEALYVAMDEFLGLDVQVIREGSVISLIEQKLRDRIKEIGGSAEGTMHMVGQSHIDIAWLWPARETVRKTSRTFSTVNALMDEYPDYQYAQSQPLLFEYLKNNDPVLYEKVKARIREGRWELVGGMWIEPDLNIPSGESLMRQMLYGQRFYQEEFGQTSQIEWLPDTFGYCASLPQILKHGGIEYFMTTKLGWNDTNVFPYDLFHWVGIDGTPMLSYLNHGVNENTLPKDIHEHYQSFREKDKHNEQMLLYGHGDGGGGVTREMLEYIQRAELMVGQPASKYSNAADFFAGITRSQPQLPQWRGDLYLELHRGTYTTHARNKRNNRQAEILYREAELWQTLASTELDAEQRAANAQRLHQGWKLILLNQFHDIIPGSAITEAYETSKKEYKEIFDYGHAALQPGLSALAGSIAAAGEGSAFVIFNSLGWTRDAVVELELNEPTHGRHLAAYDEQGLPLKADLPAGNGSGSGDGGAGTPRISVFVPGIPAFGYKTIWIRSKSGDQASEVAEVSAKAASGAEAKTAEAGLSGLSPAIPLEPVPLGDGWETEYYRLAFNERGEISSLFDKQAGREIVKPGERANRLHFFHDRPTLWDAWDIDSRYEAQPAGEAELIEKTVLQSGTVQDVLRFRWRLGQSGIIQDLILYHQDRRIDFKTHVSWHEAHKLLKVGFPLDLVAEKATYEIPFGALERPTHRNTSWEQAQYEVCGHRFADVSERGYGVSLLNDCKYGYDIQGSTIRLSLLRAPKWPDATADLGEHDFTYSLYPHEGDWREAHTLRRAAELNHGLYTVAADSAEGKLPASGSFIGFSGEHVVLDTIKPSEDGGGTVLRLYESSGGRERLRLQWKRPVQAIYLSNALEEQLEQIAHAEGEVELQFAPYEIKTLYIKGSNP
ncbi:alpha-mannosidase [Paenibacillus albidus]|uniref:alpha-mannosidase n=1 Tax=Paenibacillus albidus TaxID=2041023 RepID=A0A917CIT7_9BACL|nr:glycoside hydrolase family 38 C-terminal domain-containing protein [Paenibacillus albidus]GGF89978.1 alpha-mannosidase [Paenibacillus albidus]